MKMNEGSFLHAWGGSPVADTLGAGASPSHSAPGVLAPWMLAVLVRKCLAARGSRGVGLVRRERRQWTLCSFPGMGNRECSWARNRALGRARREHPLPLLWRSEPRWPCWAPWRRKTRHRGGQACVGPLVHLCTPLQSIQSHTFTNNPQPCTHTMTH